MLKENPVEGIPFLPVEKRLRYVPSPEDIEKVIAQADPDPQDYLYVIQETMGQMCEVNRLTWEDVNLDEKLSV
ncbi:MAG: tyrosine-type recombinase/integrase, partial [Thermodesulfobacteriota bacterium]